MAAREWFEALTGHKAAHEWQERLAGSAECGNRVIRVPTGLGKTEGVLGAWSYHRVYRGDERWPRRLVWCLPMRVLVEQTVEVARRLAERMPAEGRPEVHAVMGGEDAGEWHLAPERAAILVGTQDMLLSRAMMRGYGSGRARWPMEFGLLSQDALWVMDEIQLMDVGLATSAQLQAYRDQDGEKSLRPCHTWWMSATLQKEWLRSVDTEGWHASWTREAVEVRKQERTGRLWEGKKPLKTARVEMADAAGLAGLVLEEHGRAKEEGGAGGLTLVVCNTVERARGLYERLRQGCGGADLRLIHSRFRPAEREAWRETVLSKEAVIPAEGRIVVSTQVVEAGVDISARVLVTELAPWPSLVQRFGRCGRYGEGGRVVVVERGRDEKAAAPYTAKELESAWEAVGTMAEVGVRALEEFEARLTEEGRKRLYPYEPSHLLTRSEYEELFDTTADLTGGDLDVSRFIRSGEERDLHVFWVEIGKEHSGPERRRPQRKELCAAPYLAARNWLCGEETKNRKSPRLKKGMRAWVWDWLDGEWKTADRASLTPGRTVCVAADCGGYDAEYGFRPESREPVVEVERVPETADCEAAEESDNRQDVESLSAYEWKTIGTHGGEVAEVARALAEEVGLGAAERRVLELAGRWHDVGKSHEAFQGSIRGAGRPGRRDLAKAPEGAWLKPWGAYRYGDDSETRPSLRHELASALALFAVLEEYAPRHEALLGPWVEALEQMGMSVREGVETRGGGRAIQEILGLSAEEFDLAAYLVASHHGKVRMALHAAPKDQEYRDGDGRGLPVRGVREGDELPEIWLGDGWGQVPGLRLTLEPAAMGLSGRTGASWQERCMGLLKRYGPGALGYLEALLRAADVRASRMKTADGALAGEVGQ